MNLADALTTFVSALSLTGYRHHRSRPVPCGLSHRAAPREFKRYHFRVLPDTSLIYAFTGGIPSEGPKDTYKRRLTPTRSCHGLASARRPSRLVNTQE